MSAWAAAAPGRNMFLLFAAFVMATVCVDIGLAASLEPRVSVLDQFMEEIDISPARVAAVKKCLAPLIEKENVLNVEKQPPKDVPNAKMNGIAQENAS